MSSNRPTAFVADYSTHPLGSDRATRVDRWRAIAAFGDEDDMLTKVAKMAVELADSDEDDETLARRAVFVLGLGGPKKADRNGERLREALHVFHRLHEEAFGGDAPEDVEHDKDLERRANRKLAAIMREGLPRWLFRRTMGHGVGSERSHRQQLRRIAKADRDALRILALALNLWDAHKATKKRAAPRSRTDRLELLG